MSSVDFFEQIDLFSAKETLFRHDASYVVGVSGGVDSIVLSHYLLNRFDANRLFFFT